MILLQIISVFYLGYGLYLGYLFMCKEIELDHPYKKYFRFWFYVVLAAIFMVVAGPICVVCGMIKSLYN